jgi:hypothetical protein
MAVVVATELAKALDCTVNDLPLSLALSHLEQKAAAFLLTMLSTNAKDDLVILAELCERITVVQYSLFAHLRNRKLFWVCLDYILIMQSYFIWPIYVW